MQTELVTKIHNRPVELRVRDLLLNALTVSSGAIDAISFLALGKVFSAFMTGNIAFLGLRVAGAGAPGAVAIVVSMAAFAVGVYHFNPLGCQGRHFQLCVQRCILPHHKGPAKRRAREKYFDTAKLERAGIRPC
jgi:hypothetical protein